MESDDDLFAPPECVPLHKHTTHKHKRKREDPS